MAQASGEEERRMNGTICSRKHIKCGFVHFSMQTHIHIHTNNRLKRKQILLAYFIYVIPCALAYCVVISLSRARALALCVCLKRKAISNFVECLRSHSHSRFAYYLFIYYLECMLWHQVFMVRSYAVDVAAASWVYFIWCLSRSLSPYVCVCMWVWNCALVFCLSFQTILYVFHFYCDKVRSW